MSGSKNSLSASVYPHGKADSKKDTLYTVDGSWTDTFTIRAGGGSSSKSPPLETYNSKSHPKTPLQVPALDDQDPLESRRAWRNVAEAIQRGDMNATANEKSRIEEQQRALRKKESSEGREWERRFFVRQDKASEVVERLFREAPGTGLEREQTGGVWVLKKQREGGGGGAGQGDVD